MNYFIEPLNANHIRKNFSCGKSILDDYIKVQARQDIKRKLSTCFVLTDEENNVIGYYTLSNTAIERDILPNEIIKKLPPSYKNLPATLLGRLAVDQNNFGKKLGEFLLIDAMKKSVAVAKESIGSMALIVDPIDENAIAFYTKYGFIQLPHSGKMFLPMQTIAKLFID
ncbi:GNAT family N-acetyltransferase [Sediminibacterium sp.]|uniref:GNAT family N-acetyltransferase n=1 Tax=Sediminibacterium sp. TaxID=1917865 RepID=UPI003F7039D5